MVSFFIPSKAFSKYEVDKPAVVGCNLDNLSKILNSTRSNEQLVMKDDGNKLSLEFVGQNSRRRYKLPLIDVRKDPDKEPKIVFESTADVKGDSLKEILKDANLLSSYVNFKTDKGMFKVIAKGDAGELEEEHMDNAEFINKLDVLKAASSTFNLEYLTKIIAPCPTNSHVTISLKTEEPVRIEYSIGDASVSYYLAPYMES
jgi:proliferating cell nuclear antigen